MPGGPADRADIADDWDRLAEQNTDAGGLSRGARAIGLELAFVQCEQIYGAAWAYAPHRWKTDDGFVPFPVCWIYWRALDMRAALDALATARAIGIAFGDGEAAVKARRAVLDDALPPVER